MIADFNPDARTVTVPDRARIPDFLGDARTIGWNADGTLDLSGRIDLLGGGAVTAAQRRANRTNADLITVLGAVYAAIRRRMRMVARPEIVLQRRTGQEWRDVDDPNHPALLALRRGNGALTGNQAWMLIEAQKLSAGCAYWIKRRNRLNVPVEFEIWDPLHTAIIRDKSTPWRPAAYKLYRADGSTVTVAAEDVIPFRHFVDPREPLLSLSPIGAVRVTLDTGAEAQRWNRTFFDNNAMPPAILSGEEVGPAELARIEEKISRTNMGTDNAFKVLALEGNMKLVASPISHDDMQFLEQQMWTVEEVARVMELSSISLNDLRHGTYSNYDQAQISDWTAIQDQVDCTLEELNEYLIRPDFGDDLRLVARYDGIPALQTDRLKQAQVDEINLRTGKNIINELRDRDGEEAVGWGDTPLISNTIKPLLLGPDGKPVVPEPVDETKPADAGAGKQDPKTDPAKPETDDEKAARILAELRADPVIARQLAENLLAEAGEGLDEVFRRTVQAGEERLLDEAARVLRLEMRLLFEYLDGLPELTPEASAGHDWRGWYDRNHGDLAAAIARVYLATLQEAGYPGGTLVSAKDLSVRYASARAGELLRLDTAESITVTTRARVRELVARTLEEGQSLRWLKQELRGDGLSFSDDRAERIARTETANAQGDGKLQSYVQIGYEGKRWVTAAGCDHEGCVINQQAGAIRLAQAFPSGHRTVPAHPNCLPGWVPVLSPGTIATSQRWYDGDLIIIRTASGKELPATPNHPVLTPAGWVSAGALDEGGYVISSRRREWITGGSDPNNHDMPARIEDVVEAFGRTEQVAAVTMPVAAEDFHGDGVGSQVAVIRANGLLGDNGLPPFLKHDREVALSAGDVQPTLLNGACVRDSALQGGGSASDGIMGGAGPANALLRRPSSDGLAVGITNATQSNSRQLQAQPDRRPAHTILSSKSDDGCAALITADEFILRQGQLGASPSSCTLSAEGVTNSGRAENAPSLQLALQLLGSDMPSGTGVVQAGAVQVEADRILHVDRVRFSGHVYNLQTVTGWYEAAGIITHNCRCTILPVNHLDDPSPVALA